MANEVSSLESEIEQTRERLAHTVDQLAFRANPKTIVSREVTTVRGYFVDAQTGKPRTDNILKVAGTVAGVVAIFVLVRVVTR